MGAERNAAHTAELRQTLTDLRTELRRDINGRVRESRTDRSDGVVDQVEDSDDDVRQGLDLALLEMRANTITAIDDAIARLDAGRYGFCFECDAPIAIRRLRALPFAVRCRECEEEQEQEQAPGRQRPPQRAGESAIW